MSNFKCQISNQDNQLQLEIENCLSRVLTREKLKIPRLGGAGFTLPELIVAVSIVITLLGLATINLLNIRSKTAVTSGIDTFLADVRQQQVKAINGDTEGRSFNSAYGIRFNTTNYTLFYDTYTSGFQGNFTVNLDEGQQFQTILFPASQLIFATHSGEIVGFTPGAASVTVLDTSNGETKTIQFNRYGVVTAIN